MSRWKIGWAVAAVLLMLAAAPKVRAAQTCDDGDACTTNDMCTNGMCSGTFQPGAGCDDGNDCTVNDQCVMDPERGPTCEGDPAPTGTSCGGGCGTCQQVAPIPGVPLICGGDPADAGKSCDPGSLGLGKCFVGSCSIVGPTGFAVAFCLPAVKTCPDTDGDPCTDNCNFQTGQCEKNAPKCDGVCATCNHTSGMCDTTTLGIACDDQDPCSTQSSCQTIQGVSFAVCLAGAATVSSPTPTVTHQVAATATATRTPPATSTQTSTAKATSTATATATQPGGSPGATPTATNTTAGGATATASPTGGTCAGDCNHNGLVAINELVIGVNILLGNAPLSVCPSFDTNGNKMVAVNEIVTGVNALLNGCPA